MKKLILSLFLMVFAGFAQAQTILTNTTLSAAVTTSSTTTVSLTSATNVYAPTPLNNTQATFLYVDREAMYVVAVNGTTLHVVRGQEGTAAAPHASGAVVFVIPAYLATMGNGGVNYGGLPQGSCTRASVQVLPVIQFSTGTVSDCLGGQWVQGDAAQTTRGTFYRLEAPTIGAVSNAAAIGTNSTAVAAELYCTEIRMPYSRLLTGLAPHIGTTGGTDKWIVALYDSGGNLIANSAVAGATVGSGNAWQATAFTAPYYAVGPAQYYGCLMSNGTTATIDTVTTGKDDNILTFKSASAGTFGTLPNFTAPTSFNSVSGPYMYAY